jgi:hypothetical protein
MRCGGRTADQRSTNTALPHQPGLMKALRLEFHRALQATIDAGGCVLSACIVNSEISESDCAAKERSYCIGAVDFSFCRNPVREKKLLAQGLHLNSSYLIEHGIEISPIEVIHYSLPLGVGKSSRNGFAKIWHKCLCVGQDLSLLL